MPNRKILAEKRENGKKVKTWTWRDKPHFKRVLWVTVGSIGMAEFGKGSKSAWSKALVDWNWGMDILTKTELGDAIEAEPALNYINAYCDRKGMTRPKDVRPKYTKVADGQEVLAAQTWLAGRGQGKFAAPQAPSAGSTKRKARHRTTYSAKQKVSSEFQTATPVPSLD